MDEMPLFQQATLAELISELGKEDTAEVLKIFLADTSSKMRTIASDLQARSTIEREAHSIKSSSATFGFVELSRLARELESGAGVMSPADLQESARVRADRKVCARQLADVRSGNCCGVEHDPERWVPVFRKDHAQIRR